MKWKPAALLMVFLLLPGGVHAGQVLYTINGLRVILQDPVGMCPLDEPGSEVEAAYLEYMARVHGDLNAVIAFYIPCTEIDSFRRAENDAFERWGMVLAPLNKGKQEPMAGFSRKEYIWQMAKVLNGGLDLDPNDMRQRFVEALPEEGREPGRKRTVFRSTISGEVLCPLKTGSF